MSRFLVTTIPAAGHVAPMLQVVRALVERGHEVVWYSSRSFQARIEAAGARFVPPVHGIDVDEDTIERDFPDRAKYKGLAQVKYDFKHFFIDTTPGMVADLCAILREFPADVLLTDPIVIAGRILNDEGLVPWAMLNITVMGHAGRDVAPFGLGILPSATPLGRLRNRALYWLAKHVVFRDVQKHYDRVCDRQGWKRGPFFPGVSPYLLIQPSVPEFDYPRSDLDPQIHFVGPLLPEAPKEFAPPAWWSEVANATKPVILVTQGTVATDADQLIAPALQALAGEDVLVVATTGGKTAEELSFTVPANARVAPFIPFTTLMPHVNIMITNGGYGGVTIALAHGVPVIGAGTTEDKMEVNNRVAYAGVGINLRTATPKPQQVRDAVRAIMSDPRYQERAHALAFEMAQHDARGEAAQLLEQLAVTKQPVLLRSQTQVDKENVRRIFELDLGTAEGA